MADQNVVLRLDSGPLVPAANFVTDDREVIVTVYGTEVSQAEAVQIREQAARGHLTLAEGYAEGYMPDAAEPADYTDVPPEVANGEAEPTGDPSTVPQAEDPEAEPTGEPNEHFEPVELPVPQADETAEQSPDTETTEQADQGGEPDSNA